MEQASISESTKAPLITNNYLMSIVNCTNSTKASKIVQITMPKCMWFLLTCALVSTQTMTTKTQGVTTKRSNLLQSLRI